MLVRILPCGGPSLEARSKYEVVRKDAKEHKRDLTLRFQNLGVCHFDLAST